MNEDRIIRAEDATATVYADHLIRKMISQKTRVLQISRFKKLPELPAGFEGKVGYRKVATAFKQLCGLPRRLTGQTTLGSFTLTYGDNSIPYGKYKVDASIEEGFLRGSLTLEVSKLPDDTPPSETAGVPVTVKPPLKVLFAENELPHNQSSHGTRLTPRP
jgi:hypothetical protein